MLDEPMASARKSRHRSRPAAAPASTGPRFALVRNDFDLCSDLDTKRLSHRQARMTFLNLTH